MLGGSELALRSLPFACGIASVFLIAGLARRIIGPPWDTLAVLMFGTSEILISHATEVKQYGTDTFVALLLTWLTMGLWRKGQVNGVPVGSALRTDSSPISKTLPGFWRSASFVGSASRTISSNGKASEIDEEAVRGADPADSRRRQPDRSSAGKFPSLPTLLLFA